MSQLYDRAEIYDLIESEKRTEIIRKDWKQFIGDREIHSLLDVSIGTGGMTLPLQELGIEIYGSDLSEAMLSRCNMKAAAKNSPIELKCSDFRDLSCWEDRQFDCVASTGNALAYVSNEDVLIALERMDAHVHPGGYLCFDSRNWEMIQKEKQRFYVYQPFFHNGTRVNLVQVWDHNPDGSITFNLLYTFEQNEKIVQKEIFEEHYHPFSIKIVEEKLGKRSSIKKECTIAGYKSDLYIEDTKTVVEIKSILSFRGEAEFPSVYSQRAVDQLMKIEDLLEKGYLACYVFVSLNPKVKQLTLNNELITYRDAFHNCIEKGMVVKGVAIKLKDGEPLIWSSLKINV